MSITVVFTAQLPQSRRSNTKPYTKRKASTRNIPYSFHYPNLPFTPSRSSTMIHLLIKKDYHTFNCPSFFNFNLLILGWSLSIFPRSPLTRPYTTTTIITTIWNEISFVWSTLSILRYDRLPSFDKLIIISILKEKPNIFNINKILSKKRESEGIEPFSCHFIAANRIIVHSPVIDSC